LPAVVFVLATIIDYLDRHGTAFSFLTALVLALLTGAYVVLTARLAASQEQATRASTEPVLIARTAMTDAGLRVTVKNASTAVASGVRLYTGTGSIATVRERTSDLALFAGEEAHFHLDRPDGDEQDDALVVLWGGQRSCTPTRTRRRCSELGFSSRSTATRRSPLSAKVL
jgi:hypothetical protein